MNILVLSPFFPVPPDNGSKIRAYNLIRHLARSHSLDLISFKDRRAQPSALEPLCRRVVALDHDLLEVGLWRRISRRLRALPSSIPISIAAARHRGMAAAVASALKGEAYHAVIAETLLMAQYLPPDAVPPLVLDEHNVEFAALRQRAATSPIRGRLWRLDAARLRRYELAALARARICLVPSELDRHILLQEAVDADQVKVLPNGIDLSLYQPPPIQSRSRQELVFIGEMGYAPNADAALYLCRSILPLIRREVPEARVTLVGAHPPPLAGMKGVAAQGWVPDVRPFLARAAAALVPVRYAGGTRFKVLEAMAMGTPVISTTVGAQGLEVSPEKDILLADSPQEFSTAVVRVLRDAELSGRLSWNGRRLAEDKYDWNVIAGQLDAILESLETPGSPGP